MIKTSHTARRRLCSSVFAATTLLISAHVATAGVDSRILLARTAMGTADIESIAGIVKGIADQFGTNSIKMNAKNVKSIAAYAAEAISGKISGSNFTIDNKTDEIAEAAALIVNGMSANVKFLKVSKSKPLITTVIKGVLKLASKNPLFTPTSIFRDVAGSVALTIANNAALDASQSKLQAKLTKGAKGMAGKVNKDFIIAGFTQGFAADTNANTRYEDGAIASLFLVVDPETDQRPA
jgi:hypothetical protein